MKYNKKLVLADGTTFYGNGFGYDSEAIAEVVFNTGMTGYEEIITDGAYANQTVVMTYPIIGNYGITAEVMETPANGLSALIVKDFCAEPSNWRSVATLDEALEKKGIVGLAEVDTRALMLKIRESGTMKGIIVDHSVTDADAIAKLNATSENTTSVNTTKTPYTVTATDKKFTVAFIDFGAKNTGIINELTDRRCEVRVLPSHVSAEELSTKMVDGVVLGNGPEVAVDESVLLTIKTIVNKYPTFGLGYGHQLVAQAFGAKADKLAMGHRGANIPVMCHATGRTLITSQNHGWVIVKDSLAGTELEVTHTAINDGTVQGIRHMSLPVFGVQFIAEAHTGPADAAYLFDQFVDSLGGTK